MRKSASSDQILNGNHFNSNCNTSFDAVVVKIDSCKQPDLRGSEVEISESDFSELPELATIQPESLGKIRVENGFVLASSDQKVDEGATSIEKSLKFQLLHSNLEGGL